jgi:hypothetical protein
MKITLRLQAGADALPALTPEGGQGPVVCCANQPDAVASAQRLYPDRRIEVKKLFSEPELGPGRGLLGWMLHARADEESHETVRRRVIDSSIRLIDVAKQDGEATLVAGPRLLRLLAIKLNSIGYRGTLLGPRKAGQSCAYDYTL